jgi:hypothetical protein
MYVDSCLQCRDWDWDPPLISKSSEPKREKWPLCQKRSLSMVRAKCSPLLEPWHKKLSFFFILKIKGQYTVYINNISTSVNRNRNTPTITFNFLSEEVFFSDGTEVFPAPSLEFNFPWLSFRRGGGSHFLEKGESKSSIEYLFHYWRKIYFKTTLSTTTGVFGQWAGFQEIGV